MIRRTSVAIAWTTLLLAGLGCGRGKPTGENPQLPGAPPPSTPLRVEPGFADPTETSGALKPHYYGRVVVVGIGISNYKYVDDKADYAEQDCEEMLKLFRKNYGFETIFLKGDSATRKAILETLDKLKAKLGERDVLIVYFAGHGQVIDKADYGSAGYLVPHDADLRLSDTARPEEWAERALDMRGLTKMFEGTEVRHVLFIVDACCSGFMTRRGDFPARSDLQELMLRRSRTVLAATTDRRPALPNNETGHGFFTGPLLDELKKDNAKSVTELFLVAQRQTVAKTNRAMLPQRGEFGAEYGEFVFIPKAISENEVAAAIEKIKDAELKRSARRTLPEHLYELLDVPQYQFSTQRAKLEIVWKQRIDRFRENAALGDPMAMAALCLALARNPGPDPSAGFSEAYRVAKKAFETGRPAGKFALGYCFITGTGVEKNELAGRELLAGASAEGFLLANVVLADQALVGTPSAAEIKRIQEWLDQAEAAGIPVASVRRVTLELKGSPTTTERGKWIERVRPAAEAGNAVAQMLIFELLTLEPAKLGTTEKAEALKRLTQAAEAGLAEAQFRLAIECYQKEWFKGRLNRSQDFVAAREWATLAAEQGITEANKILVMIYILGDGVKVDILKAQNYYKRFRAKSVLDIDFWQWFTDREVEAREKLDKNK